MELKLNIYKNQREIDKTYTADTYDLMWGTVDDVLSLFDLESLDENVEVIKAVVKSINAFKPLLKDIFYGLTDEELRRTKAKEIVPIIVAVAREAYEQMGAETKNLMRGHK